MLTLKKGIKNLTLCCLLMSVYAISNGQEYYGGDGNGSWRKKQENKNTQPKDKDAANSEPSGYLSINAGFALPEGTLGQAFSQNSFSEGVGIGYGGYALPGSNFHFSLGIPISHSNFGIAFMFGSYDNQYDINNYVNSLNNSPLNYNAYSSSPITGYGVAPSQNDYNESSIMGGLFVTYPVGRLSIDGRLMIGALLNSLPEQNVYAQDLDGDELEYDLQASNSTSLAFDAGIGFRFLLAEFGSRKLCIMVNADYLYSSVSYNTAQYLYVIPASGPNAGYQGQLVPTPSVTGSLPIQLLNISFGIGYQL